MAKKIIGKHFELDSTTEDPNPVVDPKFEMLRVSVNLNVSRADWRAFTSKLKLEGLKQADVIHPAIQAFMNAPGE
jgi:hypothetical protein